jgi:hypothetical protein
MAADRGSQTGNDADRARFTPETRRLSHAGSHLRHLLPYCTFGRGLEHEPTEQDTRLLRPGLLGQAETARTTTVQAAPAPSSPEWPPGRSYEPRQKA